MAAKEIETENGVGKGFQFRKHVTRTKWQSFQNAVYDPTTKEFIGRTGKNWGQLLVFYSIFYLVLAALFAICMQGLLATLDDKTPRWTLDRSLIGTNPGLGFRPISNVTEEGSLIRYKLQNLTSVAKWTHFLDGFLKPYYEDQMGKNFVPCSFGGPSAGQGEVCMVDMKDFGPCQTNNSYGYASGSPCIFLKLNKIYGWRPEYITKPNEEMSKKGYEDLTDKIASTKDEELNQVWISCAGESPFDREQDLHFEYYPTRGFADFYFPYTNQDNYLSPLVAVHLKNPPPNVLVSIECRAWAKNIKYRGGDLQREGSVRFEVLIEDDSKINSSSVVITEKAVNASSA